MDHLSSGRRERSDSTDFNQASTAYMTDPRTYDPSYSNSGHGSTNNEDAKNSMYQPTIYDPQYSQPDYWQVQAQQWKVMQAANGDPSSVSSSTNVPPLPIPPHLQQNHHSSVGSPSTSSKQPTPHQTDHHTPPSLSRTDSPLLDKDSKNIKSVDVNEDKLNADKKEVEKEDTKANSLDHSVDLDTRLKMLMKDKSSAVPAFLLESLQTDEEEEEEVEQALEIATTSHMNKNSSNTCSPSPHIVEDLKPLSRAPSPFISRDHYLVCHEDQVKIQRAKQEREMDRGSQKRQQGGKSRGRRGGRPESRNSDAMSLSSLSSGENNILEEGPMIGSHPHYYGYSSYPVGAVHPSDASGYYQSSGAVPGSYHMYPGSTGHPNVPPHFMGGSQYPGMHHNQYGEHDWGYNWGGNAVPGYPTDDPMLMYQGGKSDKKTIRPLVRYVSKYALTIMPLVSLIKKTHKKQIII